MAGPILISRRLAEKSNLRPAFGAKRLQYLTSNDPLAINKLNYTATHTALGNYND